MARNTPNPVQQYRGTTAQHANYAGAAGEITVDTTKKTVVVQDGVTKGGTPLAKESTQIIAGEALFVNGPGDLSAKNTIGAYVGSKAQRGVLQVGDNIDVSNGVISTLDWTAEVEELDASNATALSDELHDAAFVSVTGENTSVVGRSVGELVWALLPVRAAGFQLLDGSLIYSTGIYAAFYNYIVQLKNTGEHDNLFITETEWQNSVTTYGVCGKFVLDTTAGTVRIPKVTGHVEGTIDKNAVGDLIEAGLPDVTGDTGLREATDAGLAGVSGAFYFDTVSSAKRPNYSGSSTDTTGLLYAASLSDPIYGNATTVQTQSIKGYLYMIVGTYAKSDLQVNIDNVASDMVHQGARIAVVEDRIHIVETWRSDDGTAWYRKWSDGWIEQGGIVASPGSSSTEVTVVFPTEFANTHYLFERQSSGFTQVTNTHVGRNIGYKEGTKKTLSIVVTAEASIYATDFTWRAYGY